MSSQNNKPHYALNLKLFPKRYQMDIIDKTCQTAFGKKE